jgi:NAD+ diphosphatase
MIRSEPHIYAGSPLDRAAHLRKDPAGLSALMSNPESRMLPVWQLKTLVVTATPATTLAWQAIDGLADGTASGEVIFLGLDGDAGRFAVGISGEADPVEAGALKGAGSFEEVRGLASRLPANETSIAAQARTLIGWHDRHRFCAQCGTPTEVSDGGYRRDCPNKACGARHFPRTDPVVIMMAVKGDMALLGRQAFWVPGMFSTLAGFIDPGETIEEAVRREIFEEAGVQVGDVLYHSSQPWPFPSSLMIGCIGQAESEELNVDTREVEDAGWFTRDQVRAGIQLALSGPSDDGTFHLPFPASIAHQLAAWWVDNG